MISYINGAIKDRIASDKALVLIVESGGVGYKVHTNLRTYNACRMDDHITLTTHLDDKDLYGFLDDDDRDMFARMLATGIVKPYVAIALLSFLDAPDLVAAIHTGDASLIYGQLDWIEPDWTTQLVQLLGKDEDKGKVEVEQTPKAKTKAKTKATKGLESMPNVADAISGLRVLGHSKAEAKSRVQALIKIMGKGKIALMDAQDIVQKALSD